MADHKRLKEASEEWQLAILSRSNEWKQKIEKSAEKYCKSMTEFLGYTPHELCKAYEETIKNLSAKKFEESIKNKKEKWLNEMLEFLEK